MALEKGIFQRSELLFGKEKMNEIARKKVIIFGIGGVGSWCAESLVRTRIRHLTLVDVVDKLDMRGIYNQYKGVGSTAYDPRMLLSLLFYGYSTGVFSSRKIESATYDSFAFRFVAGNHNPDPDTIADFRKRFIGQLKGWFKEILLIGKEFGLVKLGNIYIDGSKVQANASRHKAMSYEYIQKSEKQLEEEIEKLLDLATAKDESEKDLDLNIPEELKL